MTASIAGARRARLAGAMAEEGVDLLLVYGNAWQSDYLRYATDYGILEGEGLALVRHDGATTLFLDRAKHGRHGANPHEHRADSAGLCRPGRSLN